MGLLEGKVAVIYGAGAIGSGVASAFTHEGARVHLTSRRAGEGVVAVDALDERAIEAHLDSVGKVDVIFHAVGFSHDATGQPLTSVDARQVARLVSDSVTSWLLTARCAARRMLPSGSGVLLTVTAVPARTGSMLLAGYGAAMAAKDALTRDLSMELAPRGLRVVGLRPHAIPETPCIRRAFEPRAAATKRTWEEWQSMLAARTHRQRLLRLEELTRVAAFVASDGASALTGTNVNLTMGNLDD